MYGVIDMNLKNEKTTIVYGITILMFILNVYFVFSLHLLKKITIIFLIKIMISKYRLRL